MLNYVSDRSVAMLLSPTPGSLSIGSATCIRIGDHYLLATAAHNIADITDDAGIRLLPYGRNDHAGMPFLRRSHPRQSAFAEDVAWLEVREDEVLAGGLSYFGLEDLQPYQAHDPLKPFFLQGYPAAEVEMEGDEISPLSLGLKTISLEPRGNEELIVEYPPQSEADIGLELTHPGGISGGGVWLESRFQDTLIWSPVQSRLVAIATTWEEATARLEAVRVEHWLELVVLDFPDLQPVIAPLLVRPAKEERCTMNQEPQTLISPHFSSKKLDSPSIDDLVDVFEDRLSGWLLGPAKKLLERPADQVAGFALSLSYFEGIFIYLRGEDSKNKSRQFFREGFVDVFRSSGPPVASLKRIADVLYEDGRCGFFHDAMFRTRVYFSEHFGEPLVITVPKVNGVIDEGGEIQSIVVHCPKYFEHLERHFTKYVARLRDSSESDLRKNFQVACELKWGMGAPPPVIVL